MPQPPEITALIEDAIRDRLVLRVRYRALDGTAGRYEIEPLAIRFNRAQHRVLWCWNRVEGHLMDLLWDRLEGAEAMGETFPARPWIEPEDESEELSHEH